MRQLATCIPRSHVREVGSADRVQCLGRGLRNREGPVLRLEQLARHEGCESDLHGRVAPGRPVHEELAHADRSPAHVSRRWGVDSVSGDVRGSQGEQKSDETIS